MISGRFKKGKCFVLEDNKINQDRTVEDEINYLLSKGWKLRGRPDILANSYGMVNQVVYHLIKD